MKSAPLFLLLLFVDAAAQVPTMKAYVNDRLGFEMRYPATYRVTDLPCSVARGAAYRGAQSLLFVSTGAGRRVGNIHVTLDKRRFNLETLQSGYAHTGEELPNQIQIGSSSFYYYGGGGGGVAYPDDYFYNLNGYILRISFDGPYPPTEKSPSKETKQMEKRVLESLRTFQPAQKVN